MLDEDDRRRAGRAHCREPGRQLAGAVGIQVCRRLVEDQDAWGRREGPGDGEALLLAARESRRSSSPEAGEAELGERLRDTRLHLPGRPPEALEAERDLVVHALHDQLALRVLEDDPDLPGDQRLGVASSNAPTHHKLAIEAPRDRTRHQPCDRPGQRALPRAGRPDDQETAARGKVERDVGDRRGHGARVGDPDVAGTDRAWAACAGSCAGSSPQRGKPSRTPARRSARASMSEPNPTMTTAETPIAAPTSSWVSTATVG